MESFLPILQRTMEILTMPGRLGTVLMADINFKFGPTKYPKHKFSEKQNITCSNSKSHSLMIFLLEMQMVPEKLKLL